MGRGEKGRTDDHGGELETLPDTLPVNLVGEVGKADIAHEFLADYGRNGGLVGGGQGRGRAIEVAVGGRGEVAVAAGGVRVGHLRERELWTVGEEGGFTWTSWKSGGGRNGPSVDGRTSCGPVCACLRQSTLSDRRGFGSMYWTSNIP